MFGWLCCLDLPSLPTVGARSSTSGIEESEICRHAGGKQNRPQSHHGTAVIISISEDRQDIAMQRSAVNILYFCCKNLYTIHTSIFDSKAELVLASQI
jgi:hypothetical protein